MASHKKSYFDRNQRQGCALGHPRNAINPLQIPTAKQGLAKEGGNQKEGEHSAGNEEDTAVDVKPHSCFMPTQANVPPTPHPHIASKRLVASEQPHWNLPRRRSAAIELIGAHPSHATPPHATAPLAGCPGQIKRGGDGFGHERSDPSRVEQAGFDVRAPQPSIVAATTTPP
ncbi:Os08g0125166 [Oryza sativa Japonica Group]|uniref:Os08g0125166 protein n=1 Tax=Oryza sativa subsp. japonica TaxID=39947 RepID=A0A0P0XBA5_ORYSJ|nr:Os08g0125166 [Oryza sativa Japonica Group]